MKPKRNFRDFMYDKNDIFVALIIIIISMGVIVWCVRNVMNYPNTLDSVTTAEKVQSAVEQESKTGSASDVQAKWKNGKLAETITVDVSSDSTEAAINSLITYGIFATADQYRETCAKAGVSDADIKTGKFTFKKGSTRKQIVKQVTA